MFQVKIGIRNMVMPGARSVMIDAELLPVLLQLVAARTPVDA
jgi:hypothetical protein